MWTRCHTQQDCIVFFPECACYEDNIWVFERGLKAPLLVKIKISIFLRFYMMFIVLNKTYISEISSHHHGSTAFLHSITYSLSVLRPSSLLQ